MTLHKAAIELKFGIDANITAIYQYILHIFYMSNIQY